MWLYRHLTKYIIKINIQDYLYLTSKLEAFHTLILAIDPQCGLVTIGCANIGCLRKNKPEIDVALIMNLASIPDLLFQIE